MQKLTGGIMSGILAACVSLAAEEPPARPETSLRTLAWVADNGQDDAALWGPELAWQGKSPLVLRGRYLQGRFNTAGDTEEHQEIRATAGWKFPYLELGAGYSELAVDAELHPGWVPSYDSEWAERNADIKGPILQALGSGPVGPGPLGWTAGVTWLPEDLGDFDDLGYDGAFVDLSAGLQATWDQLRVGLGYRWISFKDLPARITNEEKDGRDTQEGVYIDLTMRF